MHAPRSEIGNAAACMLLALIKGEKVDPPGVDLGLALRAPVRDIRRERLAAAADV